MDGLRYIVGLDAGQAHDFSAAVVVRRLAGELHVTSIARAPLRTSYVDIARAVVRKCVELEPAGPLHAPTIGLVADGGGVGRGVSDMIRAEIRALPQPAPRIEFWPVSATSGIRTTVGGGYIRVPKKDLVLSAVVALQNGKLKIGDIPNADLLIRELREYRMRLTSLGHQTYEGAGRNDDLVSALCLAVWAWGRASNVRRPARTWGGRR